MNLLASLEPNRGSGRSWALLAVNLRAMCGCVLSWPAWSGGGVGGRVRVRYRRGLACRGWAVRAHFFLEGAPLPAAAFLAAPYLERACLRSVTPRLSSTPRTMW